MEAPRSAAPASAAALHTVLCPGPEDPSSSEDTRRRHCRSGRRARHAARTPCQAPCRQRWSDSALHRQAPMSLARCHTPMQRAGAAGPHIASRTAPRRACRTGPRGEQGRRPAAAAHAGASPHAGCERQGAQECLTRPRVPVPIPAAHLRRRLPAAAGGSACQDHPRASAGRRRHWRTAPAPAQRRTPLKAPHATSSS